MLFCRSPVGCCVITQGAARTQALLLQNVLANLPATLFSSEALFP
jgi:hypothetical protein